MSDDSYFVQLHPDPAGGFVATCEDVPEVTTFGRDREDATASAMEALAVALFGYADGRPLSRRSAETGSLSRRPRSTC